MEYTVEKILDSKKENGLQLFLVKWDGYDISESTWEPRSHLSNAKLVLEEFEREQKKSLLLQNNEEAPVEVDLKKNEERKEKNTGEINAEINEETAGEAIGNPEQKGIESQEQLKEIKSRAVENEQENQGENRGEETVLIESKEAEKQKETVRSEETENESKKSQIEPQREDMKENETNQGDKEGILEKMDEEMAQKVQNVETRELNLPQSEMKRASTLNEETPEENSPSFEKNDKSREIGSLLNDALSILNEIQDSENNFDNAQPKEPIQEDQLESLVKALAPLERGKKTRQSHPHSQVPFEIKSARGYSSKGFQSDFSPNRVQRELGSKETLLGSSSKNRKRAPGEAGPEPKRNRMNSSQEKPKRVKEPKAKETNEGLEKQPKDGNLLSKRAIRTETRPEKKIQRSSEPQLGRESPSPEKITNFQVEMNNKLSFEISWKKKPGNQRPKPVYMSNEEVKRKYPRILCEFYETKLKFETA